MFQSDTDESVTGPAALRGWDLVFNKDLSNAVPEMSTTSSDMGVLAKAVKILRRDIIEKSRTSQVISQDHQKQNLLFPH
jgi:hypothetical protein